MHIAYLSAEYPDKNLPSSGGIGSFVKTMADSLVANGHKVTVFLCLQTKDKVWKDGETTIISIKRNSLPKVNAIIDRFLIARMLRKYARTSKIDLIEAPDWEGLHAFLNLNIPIVTRIHGSVSYFNKIQDVKIPKSLFWFEKKALQLSNSIVAVSDFSGRYTNEVFDLKLNYNVIYNGVNVDTFSPSKTTLSNNTILYFGTLASKKGVIELAHIFNELIKINPTPKLILIGKDAFDQQEKKSTWELMQKSFTNKAIKKVVYKGTVPYSEMSKHISEATVCVFPSFAEAFPISWLEAMAKEKSIVASNIGWAKESIDNNVSGFLVNPTEHKVFANKINELLLDESLRSTISKNARIRVKSLFNQDELISRNLVHYQSLLKC